jgi:hypothetical protein
MFKNNRAQYILDGTVCRGLGGPVYCGKEFNFPADLPAQFARILQNHYGKTIYRYFPTFCDKRYLSTCGRILELLYNYWDKIGELLVLFFPLKKTTEKIYFGKVIDNVNNDYHTNLHFKWLENFKENDYKELNKRRKEIVHYTTLESQIVRNYRENVEDFDFLKNEQEEKENFCSYFKVHYKMLNDGFYHSLKLIEMK